MASCPDELYFDDKVKNIDFGSNKFSITITEISPNAIPVLPPPHSLTSHPTRQTQSRPYHDCSIIDGPLYKTLIVQGSKYTLWSDFTPWSDTSSSNDTIKQKWQTLWDLEHIKMNKKNNNVQKNHSGISKFNKKISLFRWEHPKESDSSYSIEWDLEKIQQMKQNENTYEMKNNGNEYDIKINNSISSVDNDKKIEIENGIEIKTGIELEKQQIGHINSKSIIAFSDLCNSDNWISEKYKNIDLNSKYTFEKTSQSDKISIDSKHVPKNESNNTQTQEKTPNWDSLELVSHVRKETNAILKGKTLKMNPSNKYHSKLWSHWKLCILNGVIDMNQLRLMMMIEKTEETS